jgi:hypothetical protein
MKKEKFIGRLASEIECKNEEVCNKTVQFKVEDSSLKVRFENLKAAQIELKHTIKPQLLSMEREI